jgi:hypothetical protein
MYGGYCQHGDAEMTTASAVSKPTAFQPPFRLPLRRFVFGDEAASPSPDSSRIIYAFDEAEAKRILDSGL